MRRPLCILCLAVFIITWFVALSRGIPRDNPDMDGLSVTVTGQVYERKIKNGSQVILLKDVEFSDSLFSDINKKYRGAVCYLKSDEAGDNMDIGSFVMLEGKISLFSEATNPGEFSLKDYYFENGYVTAIKDCSLKAYSEKNSPIRQRLYLIRTKLLEICNEIFYEEDVPVMEAMLLGVKDNLSKETKRMYREGGIAHILAISGLHVSIIGVGIFSALKKAGAGRIPATFISAVIMLMYMLMTGLSPSSVRAVSMFIIMILGPCLGRTYDFYTALSVAAVILVVANPYVVFYGGFVLSFVAVFGAAGFSGCICFKAEPDNPGIRRLINLFLSALSISFFSVPAFLYYYYEFPLYSVFVNILVLPSMGLLLILGMGGMLGGMLYVPLGRILGILCHLILKGYEWICLLVSRLPLNSVVAGRPSAVKLVIFYGLCILLMAAVRFYRKYMLLVPSKERKIRQIPFARALIFELLFVFILILMLLPFDYFKGTSLTMLDVGQGDGLCLQSGHTVYMIDGGSSSRSEIATNVLVPYLKYNGISEVKYWLVSHPDSDHISGLVELLEDEKMMGINVKCIMFPDAEFIRSETRDIREIAENRGVEVAYISQGTAMNISGATLTLISPDKTVHTDDANDYSEVFLFNYGNVNGLLTGDATKENESSYISYMQSQNIMPGRIDFLKVAHHGSSTSTSDYLVDSLHPQVAMISSGRGNMYGHPHSQVLDRLEKEGSIIYNTQSSGAVILHIDHTRIGIETFMD